MTRETLLKELAQMSAAERMLLVQDLWDTIGQEAWQLSPSQVQELDRRLRAYEERRGASPSAAASWAEARDRIRRGV